MSGLGSLRIAGAGALSTTVDGNEAGSVFTVESGTVTISGLTITDGMAAEGSGIENTDTTSSLTVDSSIISGNSTDGGTNSDSKYGSGGSGGNGGGIYNTGSLTIDSSTISGNTAGGGGQGYYGGSGGNGGGIDNTGAITIDSSTISENTAGAGAGKYNSGSGGSGGGIENGGSVTIDSSTISGNTAGGGASGGNGGGIDNGGSVTIDSSTISGNTAGTGGGYWGGNGGSGGGINNASTVTIDSSTISDNTTGSGGRGPDDSGGNGGNGGGIDNVGSGTIDSSTISGNTTGASHSYYGYGSYGGGIDNGGRLNVAATIVNNDCHGTITDQGYNLGPCGFSASTSLPESPTGLDPKGLQNNGGPTQTIALEPESSAINAVKSTSLCSAPDQRGEVRPTPCDIGAYQLLTPTWAELSPSSAPSARQGASMAYDPATGQFLLFGGTYATTRLDDTWVWNGTTWTQLAPTTSPVARSGATMAYDSSTGQLLLFGGNNNSALYGDTWVWTGSTWSELSPAASPPARRNASMAYDAASGQLVIFGGVGAKSAILGDTWTWTGTTWTQRSPTTSPSARSNASLAYDPATSSLVLYGGFNGGYPGDTWTWNGTTWTQQSPTTSPPPRSGTSMAFDSTTNQLVLFGGNTSTGTDLNDTWVWQGTTWTEQSPTSGPPIRNASSMADDPATGQLVLFGGVNGSGQLDDTWVWWENVPEAPAIGAATAGDASATITFKPSPTTDDVVVASYTVWATDLTNPASGGETGTGSGSPITVTGLTNGDSYSFAVTANTSEGPGAASAASNTVVPAAVPEAPTIGTATGGYGQATVSFIPSSDEGSAITSYTVTAIDHTNPANGGETATGAGSPITVTGLTNGDFYAFTVTATNGVGTGPPSAPSNTVVPATPITVTSVTPIKIPQGDSKVATVIEGSGFTAGNMVSVSATGITLKSVSVVNASTIRASTSVSSATPTGTYNITVTQSGSSATCSGCLTVTAGPQIVSATPTHVAVGSKGTVTFIGTGFAKGAKITFSGPSTTIKATNVSSTGTTITGTIKVPAGAPAGAYRVKVTNLDGGSSTCATCFAIIAAPTLTQLTPDSAARGSVTPVTLTGTGFVVGAKVAGPTGVTFTNIHVVSTTTITATMTVSDSAPTGTDLAISVTNNAAAGYGKAKDDVLDIT